MNVPDAIWKQYSSAAQWEINRAFLDLAVERGDTIRLSASYAAQKDFTDLLRSRGKGFLDWPGFSKELWYMEKLGYKLVQKVIDGQVVEFLEKSK